MADDDDDEVKSPYQHHSIEHFIYRSITLNDSQISFRSNGNFIGKYSVSFLHCEQQTGEKGERERERENYNNSTTLNLFRKIVADEIQMKLDERNEKW